MVYCSKKTGRAALYQHLNRLFHYDRHVHENVERLERVLTCSNGQRSDILCNHGNWQGSLEYAPREQYGDGAWADFEGLRVRVPEKYDDYLTQKYGDWRADLPPEEQVGHHYAEIIDLCRPQTTQNGESISLFGYEPTLLYIRLLYAAAVRRKMR